MKIIGQNNVQEAAGRRRVAQPMCLIVGLMAALGTLLAQADEVSLTPADYAAATAVLESNLQGLVRNEGGPGVCGGDGRRREIPGL
jgi:hypothetical protein